MAEFLVFTLAAPLASFGDIAPGERRVSSSLPGRSMLLGFIAAALGMRREDERHAALARSLAFAVRIDHASGLLADYHTAQVAPNRVRKKTQPRTRKAELESGEVETILSTREYRTDCAFTIAVLVSEDAPFGLDAIARALGFPQFILSVGRRACPLGLPPSPRRIEAASLAQAFAAYDGAENQGDRARLRRVMFLSPDAPGWDVALDDDFMTRGLVPLRGRTVQTRDEPVDRLRWQFSQRSQHRLHLGREVL